MNISLRRVLPSFLVPAAVLLAFPAAAQDDDAPANDRRSGITVGLRASYGLPSGDFSDGFGLDERISGVFAPQVDIGYFINRNLYVGVHGQFGVAKIQSGACPSGMDCSGRVLRLGVDVSYHFIPDAALSPWLGAGLGYEHLRLAVSEYDVTSTGSYTGVEFAHAEAGLDFRIGESVWLGPHFTATVGQYSRAALNVRGVTVSGKIEDKSYHFWLQPGVRLQVRL